MSEQITLFDEPLTPETLGDKLEEILEALVKSLDTTGSTKAECMR